MFALLTTVAVVAWIAVSVVVALVIGKSIKLRDAKEGLREAPNRLQGESGLRPKAS
ncbi:hypothetical protein [Nocardia sp. 348MFTsu5.1]|uniref:hypothetical protein n=1 Tax=Nocardia sp. 348MFTsu5.1 TaxID=1172185 RepID=UPI000382E8A4|nr:hypothetical protein [Nocardia sp. 348MFTsu5.1]